MPSGTLGTKMDFTWPFIDHNRHRADHQIFPGHLLLHVLEMWLCDVSPVQRQRHPGTARPPWHQWWIWRGQTWRPDTNWSVRSYNENTGHVDQLIEEGGGNTLIQEYKHTWSMFYTPIPTTPIIRPSCLVTLGFSRMGLLRDRWLWVHRYTV